MLQNILKLNGAQALGKNELQSINGGGYGSLCHGYHQCQENCTGICSPYTDPNTLICSYVCPHDPSNDL